MVPITMGYSGVNKSIGSVVKGVSGVNKTINGVTRGVSGVNKQVYGGNLYLYNEGVLNTSLVGGFKTYRSAMNTNYITLGATYITVNGYCTMSSDNSFDVSNYSKIVFDVTFTPSSSYTCKLGMTTYPQEAIGLIDPLQYVNVSGSGRQTYELTLNKASPNQRLHIRIGDDYYYRDLLIHSIKLV